MREPFDGSDHMPKVSLPIVTLLWSGGDDIIVVEEEKWALQLFKLNQGEKELHVSVICLSRETPRDEILVIRGQNHSDLEERA